jgi:hypothetical protein
MDQKANVLRCVHFKNLMKHCLILVVPTQEVRIDDYLKAYQSTGRPPLPCPQQPEDESQRTSLNLSPLFKPRPIRNSTLATTSSSLSPFGTVNRTGNSTDVQLDLAARITNPAELPPGQEFRLPSANVEKYYCISCMPEYTNFSQEVRFFLCPIRHT